MPRPIIDLGEWAEDMFSSLCSRAGATRNKAVQDRTGWDYLVEFPPPVIEGIPADLAPVEAAARVQIKSKRSGKPTVRLSLSNALRFAKDPLPCFVVLFLAAGGHEPVRIYVKHFWSHEIGHALKRAREAHADDQRQLHKLSLVLSFSAEDEHTDDLIAWMKAIALGFGDRYVEAKGRLVRTLGFEEGSIHGNIQFSGEDLEAFVDHQIGLRPTAPRLNVTIRQRRFGIDAGQPIFEGEPDVAHLRPDPQPCRIRVRGETGRDVWLEGSLLVPAVLPYPHELWKFRITADFVEIVGAASGDGTMTFHLNGPERRSISSFRALSDVLTVAEAGPLDLQVSYDGAPMLAFRAEMSPTDIDLDAQQLSNVITCLEKASAGLLPAELTLSLDDLLTSWNDIVHFNGLVAGTDMKGKFTLAEEIPSCDAKASYVILYDYLDVGEWTFMAVVRRQLIQFEIKGRFGKLACGEPRVLEAAVRKGKGADHLDELLELYSAARTSSGNGVLEFYGGDYRAMRQGNTESPLILYTAD